MSARLLPILFFYFYPIASSRKECARPEIDIHRDCPRIGYDCSLENVSHSYAGGKRKRAYETGDIIQCVNGARLFVKGKEARDLKCRDHKWTFGNGRRVTGSALCARSCENVCETRMPKNVAPDADEVSTHHVSFCYPCTRGYCKKPEHRLYGFRSEHDEGIELYGDVVTCAGSRKWSDENGHLYEYVACQAKVCKLPDIDVQKDCPVMGYDCSITDVMDAYAVGELDITVRTSGNLQCAPNAKLFVSQSIEDHLSCENGKWRCGEKNKATKSALCARPCENVCSYTVPDGAPIDATNASGLDISPCHKCTRPYCEAPDTFLFAYANSTSEGVTVTNGRKLSCTGSSRWADQHGHMFEHLACQYKDVCEAVPMVLVPTNCAVLGYDCSDPNTNNFTSTANGSLLECIHPSAVLFYGGIHVTIRCLRDQWRVNVDDNQVMTAVCGKDCTQCSNALPDSFPESGNLVNIAYSEKVNVTAPVDSGCATASCSKASAKLIGFPADETAPAEQTPSLSCTGKGTWKSPNGTEFKYAGCYSDSVCPTVPENDPSENCPVLGYDCTTLNNNGFDASSSGESATLQCNEEGADFFVNGEKVRPVCIGDEWRLTTSSMDFIKSATCGKLCLICDARLPPSFPDQSVFPNIRNTHQVQLDGPSTTGCSTASCGAPNSQLLGFHSDPSVQPDVLNSVTCTGEGFWIGDNGVVYPYLGCYVNSYCPTLPDVSDLLNCPSDNYCADGNSNGFSAVESGILTTLACNNGEHALFVNGAPATVVCVGDTWHLTVEDPMPVMTAVCGTPQPMKCTSCSSVSEHKGNINANAFNQFTRYYDENGCANDLVTCIGPAAHILINSDSHPDLDIHDTDLGTPGMVNFTVLCESDGYFHLNTLPNIDPNSIGITDVYCVHS